MHPIHDRLLNLTRRQFFGSTGLRLGGAALALLAVRRATAAPEPRVHQPLPGFPHHKPTAKAVIYLHMNGGPSQLDTWDYKPGLVDHFAKDLPESVRMGQRLTTMTSGQAKFPVAPTRYKFVRSGKCGTWANPELLPHTTRIVDDLA